MQDLLNFVLDAFGLTPGNIAELARSIKRGITTSFQNMYRFWDRLVGGADVEGWGLSERLMNEIEHHASVQANSIADTYTEELRNTTATFLDAWKQTHGNLDGAEAPLADMLSDWTDVRSKYKSTQIAGYETLYGANQGTSDFVKDLTNGNLIDEVSGEVLDPATYSIGVMPADSSPDACAEYAGQVFPIEEMDALPEFPMHVNCKHYVVVISPQGEEEESE